MSTMLLFTTRPASATMPVPVMITLIYWPVSAIDSRTPNTDMITAVSVSAA